MAADLVEAVMAIATGVQRPKEEVELVLIDKKDITLIGRKAPFFISEEID